MCPSSFASEQAVVAGSVFPNDFVFGAIYFDVSINFCIKYAHLSRGILWLIPKEKRIKDSTQTEAHIYVPWRIICHSNHK